MEWAELVVDAAKGVTWPLVILALAWRFTPEIRQLLPRLKKGSMLGVSVELSEQVVRQERQMEAVAASVAEMRSDAPLGEDEAAPDFNAIERGIVDTLADSPLAALLRLRHEVREILRREGRLRGFPLAAMVNTREMAKEFGAYDDRSVKGLMEVIEGFESFSDTIVNMEMQRPDDAHALATAHVNGALMLPALAYSTLHGRELTRDDASMSRS